MGIPRLRRPKTKTPRKKARKTARKSPFLRWKFKKRKKKKKNFHPNVGRAVSAGAATKRAEAAIKTPLSRSIKAAKRRRTTTTPMRRRRHAPNPKNHYHHRRHV